MDTNIEQKLREFKESLFVAAPAIVTSVEDAKDKPYKDQRANIKLKTKHKKGKEPPKIKDVPIGHKESSTFSERQLPEKEDEVWVVFSNRAIDKIISVKGQEEPEHDRVLDINDCYILGGWSVDGDGIPKTLGSMDKKDWLIGLHRDTGARIYMRASGEKAGNIVVEPPPGDRTLELTEDPDFHVALFERIMQKYNNHSHSGAVGPPDQLWTEKDMSDRVGVDK
ncbi:MAG: hypothetical protein K9L56_13500 [Clostridiales bacterium]|nr:hypothetical protein [Clostridiales bacterium]